MPSFLQKLFGKQSGGGAATLSEEEHSTRSEQYEEKLRRSLEIAAGQAASGDATLRAVLEKGDIPYGIAELNMTSSYVVFPAEGAKRRKTLELAWDWLDSSTESVIAERITTQVKEWIGEGALP